MNFSKRNLQVLMPKHSQPLVFFQKVFQTKSVRWTTLSAIISLLVLIINLVCIIRVFHHGLLRGIPSEWNFETNVLLIVSFFSHMMGFIYAFGKEYLPEEKQENGEKIKAKQTNKNIRKIRIYSISVLIFIIASFIFHIVSTILLVDYSTANYLSV